MEERVRRKEDDKDGRPVLDLLDGLGGIRKCCASG